MLKRTFVWIGYVTALAVPVSQAGESPYLLAPTFSSDPKKGTSLGAMAAYLKGYDPVSPTSIIGAMGSVSDTDSKIWGVFTKLYLKEDKHRLLAGVVGGEINNEYHDFLGSGWPIQTTDTLKGLYVRYNQRWGEHWYWGVVGVSSNYTVTGDGRIDEGVLNLVGLTGLEGVALGLMINTDTRDNQNSPSSGHVIEFSNLAYREGLGSDVDFDSYTFKWVEHFGLSSGRVLAVSLDGRWTDDAPISGYSSIAMRGYTRGEYLAPNRTSLEAEQRMPLTEKIGMNVFAGMTALYDKIDELDSSDNWYTSVGFGLSYMIKMEEKMVVRTDLAFAEAGRTAFYISFGQAY